MDKPLRIALISEHASPLAVAGGVDAGGQNVYVAHVARCLAEAGHQVDVLTRRDDPALPTVQAVRPGLRVIHIDAGPACFVRKEDLLQHMPAFLRSCESLIRTLRRSGRSYDLVHANFFMSGLVAQQLKQRFGLPYVVTFHALGLVRREHQQQADAFPPERIEIERRVVQWADAVIAECPQDEGDLCRLYDADPRRLSMVPCGCDASEFGLMSRRRARAELGLDPDEFIVLQLGRLVPRKGVDNVIRALALLPARLPSRLLVVGGDAPEPDESLTPEIRRLREVARDCGVENRVSFVGHRRRHELRRYYAAADVFATTPWYEPFGITPLEAMACGIPVVASAVGGLQYSVADGVTGYLVPPRDPVALADCLTHLQANPRLAAAMGRAGARRVRSLFTWERVARQLMAVYDGVLEGLDSQQPAAAASAESTPLSALPSPSGSAHPAAGASLTPLPALQAAM